MAEHREYRVLRSGGRGGREPGILIAGTRDRAYADRILRDFIPTLHSTEAWTETRVVSDWERLDCPRNPAPKIDTTKENRL